MRTTAVLNFWKRYTDIADIPKRLFGPTAKMLKGRAVRISDGDSFRFLHKPTPFHAAALRKGEKASELALSIRVCTIDTPETPKYGKPGQPYGDEAKDALANLLLDRPVYVRLLQKDQYGRGLGQVSVHRNSWLPFLGRTQADEHMLKKGLAEVYRGAGATYGPKGLDHYLKLEAKASKSKRGMWSQDKRESAAEYKRRNK